jgi:predicted DNA binding CopG/RHH family protein
MSSVFIDFFTKVCYYAFKEADIMGKTSSAVKRKYNEKTYDRVTVSFKKDELPVIKERAKTQSLTMSGYIKQLINADIKGE